MFLSPGWVPRPVREMSFYGSPIRFGDPSVNLNLPCVRVLSRDSGVGLGGMLGRGTHLSSVPLPCSEVNPCLLDCGRLRDPWDGEIQGLLEFYCNRSLGSIGSLGSGRKFPWPFPFFSCGGRLLPSCSNCSDNLCHILFCFCICRPSARSTGQLLDREGSWVWEYITEFAKNKKRVPFWGTRFVWIKFYLWFKSAI